MIILVTKINEPLCSNKSSTSVSKEWSKLSPPSNIISIQLILLLANLLYSEISEVGFLNLALDNKYNPNSSNNISSVFSSSTVSITNLSW